MEFHDQPAEFVTKDGKRDNWLSVRCLSHKIKAV